MSPESVSSDSSPSSIDEPVSPMSTSSDGTCNSDMTRTSSPECDFCDMSGFSRTYTYSPPKQCAQQPQKTSFHQQEFQSAICNSNYRELEHILNTIPHFVNVNFFDQDGQTALHHCCMDGKLNFVKLLLRHGANARLTNRDGWSPVHIASYMGHSEILSYLIINSKR